MTFQRSNKSRVRPDGLRRLQVPFRPENKCGNTPAVPATDKKVLLFAVHIGRTGLTLQFVVERLTPALRRLPPIFRFLPVYKVCNALVRSSDPCRGKIPARQPSR